MRLSPARRFTVIHSPEPVATFIPAPLVVVRRCVDGREMGVFPSTSRLLADRIARRWKGAVELRLLESRDLTGKRPPPADNPARASPRSAGLGVDVQPGGERFDVPSQLAGTTGHLA